MSVKNTFKVVAGKVVETFRPKAMTIVQANKEIEQLRKENAALSAKVQPEANTGFERTLDAIGQKGINTTGKPLMKADEMQTQYPDETREQRAAREKMATEKWMALMTLKDPQQPMAIPANDEYTQRLTKGELYHIVAEGYHIAYITDPGQGSMTMLNSTGVNKGSSHVVVELDDKADGFYPLVIKGKLETNDFGEPCYPDLTLADFQQIVKSKPSFENLKRAYKLLYDSISPRWYLSCADAKQVL